MTQIASPKPFLPEPADSHPFRYGWRYERRTLPDGTEESVEVPLTVEDLLHPKEGDCIPENTVHSQERNYLTDVLESRLSNQPTVRVFSDCIIDWGVPGLGDHSPDIGVFSNVRDRDRRWGIFPVAEEGALPLLLMEIVSPDDRDPRRRNNDVVIKLDHYHRAGVPLYIIVDQEKEEGPRRIIGFRDTPEGYVELIPDEHGRLLLDPVGILIGIRDNRVVCFDAATDEEIPDYPRLNEAMKEEAAARSVAERQAAAERAEAQVAKEQATAERAKAQAEAQARAALEARVRQLEAELKRRNSTPPGPEPGS